METLSLLFIATTATFGSYLLENLASSFFSKNDGSSKSVVCEVTRKEIRQSGI
jgi:hypothetical protein